MSTQDKQPQTRWVVPARRVRTSPWAAIWLGVLALTGIVQVVRAQWFDAMVFLATVVLLTADLLGFVPRPRVDGRVSLRFLLWAGSAVAVVLVFVPRHTLAMTVAMLVVAVAAVVLAWSGPDGTARPWTRASARLAWWWSGVVVVGCLWELFEFIRFRIDPAHPAEALSDIVDPFLSSPPGQAVFAVLWVGLGVFLLRRGVRR